MILPIYQVDAFTDRLFGGNPAAVCTIDFWPPDDILQKIAGENNLSETTFIKKKVNITKSGGLPLLPKLSFADMRHWLQLMYCLTI